MANERRDWSWSGELSGAVGDLGILLPLAWALSVSTGIGPARLFFFWGIAYALTGLYYRVPVSIQPLKAMAVIVMAGSTPPAMIATASALFGLLLLLLGRSGMIDRVARWFTPAMIRGIQLGIGLLLLRKAGRLLIDGPLVFGTGEARPWTTALIAVAALFLLWAGPRWVGRQLVLPLLGLGVGLGAWLSGSWTPHALDTASIVWTRPDPALLIPALTLLVLPQLPLTLGNAVLAADDTCHVLWGKQAGRVRPRRLATSIGALSIGIGLLGGFPVCHGAGGMAAHARFGGRTGRTTIVLGLALVVLAWVPRAADLLLLVPTPILAVMLGLVSFELIGLVTRLPTQREVLSAVVIGLVGLALHNLSYAVLAGVVVERSLRAIGRLGTAPAWFTPNRPSQPSIPSEEMS